MTTEFRATHAPVELRSNDGVGRLGGYAIRYGNLSKNLGGFTERVAPGAVAKSLGDKLDVVARFQHRDEFLLGRVSSGTLSLRSDRTGLDYTVDLPDTATGRDVAALAARGDLRHSSFAFEAPAGGDDWTLTDENFPLRTLTAIRLIDVAPVVNPAYPDATSGLRSLASACDADLDEIRAMAEANDLRRLFSPHTKALHIDLAARAFPPKKDDKAKDGKPPAKPGEKPGEEPPEGEDGEEPKAPPAAVENDPEREPKSPTKKPEESDDESLNEGEEVFKQNQKTHEKPESDGEKKPKDSEDDKNEPAASDDDEEKKKAKRGIERMRLELRAKRRF